MVIYPSLFEGFGLPVLEALAAGVPCVTTRSSSLPEAGGPCAYYFDPFTTGDFDRALMAALLDLRMDREGTRARALAWASGFSWERTFARMMSAIDADLLAAQAEREAAPAGAAASGGGDGAAAPDGGGDASGPDGASAPDGGAGASDAVAAD